MRDFLATHITVAHVIAAYIIHEIVDAIWERYL